IAVEYGRLVRLADQRADSSQSPPVVIGLNRQPGLSQEGVAVAAAITGSFDADFAARGPFDAILDIAQSSGQGMTLHITRQSVVNPPDFIGGRRRPRLVRRKIDA